MHACACTTCHFCNCLFNHTHRYGNCTPYVKDPHEPKSCDPYYTSGVDGFYLPNDRALGRVATLNQNVAQAKLSIDLISEPCR